MVQSASRATRSTSPVCSSAKRASPDSARNSILLGSPKIAAATARQKSTSKTIQKPCVLREAKPGSGSLPAQMRCPRARIADKVGPAGAGVCARAGATTAIRATRAIQNRRANANLTGNAPSSPAASSPAGRLGQGATEERGAAELFAAWLIDPDGPD